MTYEQLLSENSDVDVGYRHFDSDNIKGLYFNGNIAINENIDTYNERICILAEELGHHHTSSGNIIDMNNASNRRQEQIARMWAYKKLVSIDSLIDAFEHHCQGRYETAEYLGVTEQFLIECINAYMHKYGCYVRYKKYILKFNYNSICVIKN